MNNATDQRGFTLLELLVASAIFFGFMVSLCVVYSSGHSSYTRGQNRIEAQQSARVALRVLAREIRLAGYDPSDAIPLQAVPAAIQAAARDTLTLCGDLDGDAVTDRVTYRLRGSEVLREFSSWQGASFSPPVVSQVADGVSLLAFEYHDASAPSNLPIPSPVLQSDLAAIRRVTIRLVSTSEAVRSRERFPLVTDVTLRNVT